MNNLIELINIVKTINLKTSDLILVNDSNKNQSYRFYEKILKGELRTDKDAANYFFKSSTNSSKYKNLKYSLKNKLINTLFFFKAPKHYGDYNRVYLYCCKNFFAAKILINLGARKAGIDLCEKVFNKALKVEQSEFITAAARYLRIHYGTRVGNMDKFNFFDEKFKLHQKIMAAEVEAESYYVKLMIPYATSQSIKVETHENATKFYHQLKPSLDNFNSPVLHFYSAYIRILGALVTNDYPNVIDYCNDGITFFKQKDYSYITPLRVFYHNLLIGYTQTKRFSEWKKNSNGSS